MHGCGYLRYGVDLQVMYAITRFLIFIYIIYIVGDLYFCFHDHDFVFLVAPFISMCYAFVKPIVQLIYVFSSNQGNCTIRQ